MGLVTRMHDGRTRIPANLLTDLDYALDMDTAAPRAVVKPLADKLRDYHRDLNLDMEVECTEGVHAFLHVSEVDAIQRLRGWHRLRYGTVTVAAEALSAVRNVLAGLTYSWMDCHEAADGNPYGYEPEELAYVQAQLEHGDICHRCKWCEFLILRERIDALLDTQGYAGGAHYAAPAGDPEIIWRTRVVWSARPWTAV